MAKETKRTMIIIKDILKRIPGLRARSMHVTLQRHPHLKTAYILSIEQQIFYLRRWDGPTT